MSFMFPPENYKVTPTNALLANALDLTAPVSDILLKHRRNAWVQLAGHPGFFAPASGVTIWKKQAERKSPETLFYQAFKHDNLRSFMPRFYREIKYNDDYFIEIEDLLQNFENPSLMDLKMGTRTFLESEVENDKQRKDLYQKMMAINPLEPTPEEHQQQAVTKLRYMQFRENLSSSTNLGFRIEAVKMANQPTVHDWKTTKTEKQVATALGTYLSFKSTLCKDFINHLTRLRKHLEASKFFMTHELIGSSLLLMHDSSGTSGVWMIDFTKAFLLQPPLKKVSHRDKWKLGNHEDGYLTGIDNLIKLFTGLCSETNMPSSPVEGTCLTQFNSM